MENEKWKGLKMDRARWGLGQNNQRAQAGGFQTPMTSRGGRAQVAGGRQAAPGCRDWSGELKGSRPRSIVERGERERERKGKKR